jgi:hypothetical protein
MKKTKVYILGAGASKPAGAPLLKELLGEGFHLDMGTTGMDSLNKYRNFINYLENEYGIPLKRPENWTLLAEQTDIEKVLSSIDEKKSKGDNSLDVTREETVRFVFKRLEDAVTFGQKGDCYHDFVNSKINTQDSKHVIITFNYETLLEKAFLESKLRGCFSYCIDVDKDKIINFPSYERTFKDILILKLHGSLNWANCPKCSKMYLFWSQRYDHIFEKRCINCEGNLKPILIPPTRFKNLNESFKSLWSIAADKIESANEIVLIGLSLNDFDEEALNLISRIGSNNNIPRLLIADREAPDRYYKLKELTSVGNKHFEEIILFNGFEEFLADVPI